MPQTKQSAMARNYANRLKEAKERNDVAQQKKAMYAKRDEVNQLTRSDSVGDKLKGLALAVKTSGQGHDVLEAEQRINQRHRIRFGDKWRAKD